MNIELKRNITIEEVMNTIELWKESTVAQDLYPTGIFSFAVLGGDGEPVDQDCGTAGDQDAKLIHILELLQAIVFE